MAPAVPDLGLPHSNPASIFIRPSPHDIYHWIWGPTRPSRMISLWILNLNLKKTNKTKNPFSK